MAPPRQVPIGLQLARTAKTVSRSLDDALAEVGASLPVWLVLVSLKGRRHGAQRELADALGIEGPTLTHHLNKMETAGLVTRRRDPENRRAHHVELTDAGDAMFERLRSTVSAFDRRLRAGLSERDVDVLRGALERLGANAVDTPAVRSVPAAAGTGPRPRGGQR